MNKKTVILGQEYLFFDELHSTNDYIKENLSRLSHGTVVHARRQTKGKGRLGKDWFDSGGLKFSLLLKNMENSFAMPFYAGVAVYQSLREIYPEIKNDIKVKWPNDILINGKKVCGILCESRVIGDNNSEINIICGIGLNTFSEQHFFQNKKISHGDSLNLITGKVIPDDIILKNILCSLERVLKINSSDLRKMYAENCITLGKNVGFMQNGKETFGKAVDIADDFNLICKVGNEKVSVNSGEVHINGIY